MTMAGCNEARWKAMNDIRINNTIDRLLELHPKLYWFEWNNGEVERWWPPITKEQQKALDELAVIAERYNPENNKRGELT